jgi:N-methylhydantoinase A
VLVNARVGVAGILSALPQEPSLPEGPATLARSVRRIYLDDWVTTPVYEFDALAPAQRIAGPAIVESAMTTVLLRPGDHGIVTKLGWLDIAIGNRPAHRREERERDVGYR